jgi:hypothetical protein
MNLPCAVGLVVVWFPAICSSAELRPKTQRAWNEYLQRVDLRGRNSQFLWVDQDSLRAARARQGEILADSEIGATPQAVPYGLIHHWVGAVFVPGVTLAQVFSVVHDYSRYSEFYSPAVIDAALLWRSGGRNGDESGEEERIRVRYSRNEERDGGVFLEQENIVLSRAIPGSLRWLVQPAIRQLSRDPIVTSLRQTRDAVDSTAKAIDLGRILRSPPGAVSP